MTQSQVVSALVAKRGELAGEVRQHRRELQRLAEELGHLEAAIRLFDPSHVLGPVRPSQRGPRTQWFGPGECQRLVLETLRDAPQPVSANALGEALMARKGLASTPDGLAAVNKTALAVLRRLVSKGVARRRVLAEGTWAWELSG